MRTRIAIVYNEPGPSRYDIAGEARAVLGVLECVDAVDQALQELGYAVTRVPLAPPWELASEKLSRLPAETDLVFNLFEGFAESTETEALVPEMLSGLGVPFTGCAAPALRLSDDKAGAKAALHAAGVATPDHQLLTPQTVADFRLRYPCIVKPQREHASHGLTESSVVHDAARLAQQVAAICRTYGSEALVEEFIAGREFNATILGNREGTVLPVSEIVYSLPPGKPRILTFDAKWEPETPYFLGTRVACPADITAAERERIVEIVQVSFRLLGGHGYARVDMRMDEDARLNVLELNPNPDISPGTGAATQAVAAGMTYPQFIEKIVRLVLE